MDDTIRVGKHDITKEELDSVISGVRPDDMDFDAFKELRKASKDGIKGYLKGKYFFISTVLVPEGTKLVRKTLTYKK